MTGERNICSVRDTNYLIKLNLIMNTGAVTQTNICAYLLLPLRQPFLVISDASILLF